MSDLMSRSFRFVLSAVLLASLGGALHAQAQLLIVDDDGGPGADYTEISAAVAAAPPYGAVMVRSGTYAPFIIEGKPIIVTAAPGAVVTVNGVPGVDAILVRNLLVGASITLEGLTVNGYVGGFFGELGSTAVRVWDCAGMVWLQDCSLKGGADPARNSPALDATASNQVIVTRCTLTGVGSSQTGESHGLFAHYSKVFLHGCTVTGGAGEHVYPFGKNASGARVIGGMLLLERCTVQGGPADGSSGGFGGPCTYAINGGDGLSVLSAAQVILHDTTLLGGQPGPFSECVVAGQPLVVVSGTVETVPGTALAFTMTSPLLESDAAVITFDGTPGDTAIAALGVPISAFYSPAFKGVWVGNSSPVITFLGPIPASGHLALHAVLPNLLAPGTAGEIVVQGAVLPPVGKARLGEPAAVFIYDP